MTVKYIVLADEICEETEKLAKLFKRIQSTLVDLPTHNEEKEVYLDSLALSLHSFYTGVESVFENIASKVDGGVPKGERWHAELLVQMAAPLPQIRPGVISNEVKEGLRDLLAFRHKIRNIYSFYVDEDHVLRLCKSLNSLTPKIFSDFENFTTFLKSTGENS